MANNRRQSGDSILNFPFNQSAPIESSELVTKLRSLSDSFHTFFFIRIANSSYEQLLTTINSAVRNAAALTYEDQNCNLAQFLIFVVTDSSVCKLSQDFLEAADKKILIMNCLNRDDYREPNRVNKARGDYDQSESQVNLKINNIEKKEPKSDSSNKRGKAYKERNDKQVPCFLSPVTSRIFRKEGQKQQTQQSFQKNINAQRISIVFVGDQGNTTPIQTYRFCIYNFCKYLNPRYCCYLDSGTGLAQNTLSSFTRIMEFDSCVGVLSCEPKKKKSCNPFVLAQYVDSQFQFYSQEGESLSGLQKSFQSAPFMVRYKALEDVSIQLSLFGKSESKFEGDLTKLSLLRKNCLLSPSNLIIQSIVLHPEHSYKSIAISSYNAYGYRKAHSSILAYYQEKNIELRGEISTTIYSFKTYACCSTSSLREANLKEKECCRSCQFLFLLLQYTLEFFVKSTIAFQVLVFYYLNQPLQVYFLNDQDDSSNIFQLLEQPTPPRSSIIFLIMIVLVLVMSLSYNRCVSKAIGKVFFQIQGIIGIILRILLFFSIGYLLYLVQFSTQFQSMSDSFLLIPLIIVAIGPHYLILLLFSLSNPKRACRELPSLLLGSLYYSLQSYTFELNFIIFTLSTFYRSQQNKREKKAKVANSVLIALYLLVQFSIYLFFYLWIPPQTGCIIVPLILLTPLLIRLFQRILYSVSCLSCKISRLQQHKKRIIQDVIPQSPRERQSMSVDSQQQEIQIYQNFISELSKEKQHKTAYQLPQKQLSDSVIPEESASTIQTKYHLKPNRGAQKENRDKTASEQSNKLKDQKKTKRNSKQVIKREVVTKQPDKFPDTQRQFSSNENSQDRGHGKQTTESQSSNIKIPDELSETYLNQIETQRDSQIASIKMNDKDMLENSKEQINERPNMQVQEEEDSYISESVVTSSKGNNSIFSSLISPQKKKDEEDSEEDLEEEKDKMPDTSSYNLWSGSNLFNMKSGLHFGSISVGENSLIEKEGVDPRANQTSSPQTNTGPSFIDPNMGYTYIEKSSCKSSKGISDFV